MTTIIHHSSTMPAFHSDPEIKSQFPHKPCAFCGEPLARRIAPSGLLETPSAFNRRRYCGLSCVGKAHDMIGFHPNPSWPTAHAYARRLKAPGPCERCHRADAPEVHHKDGNWQNNVLSNLERLCRSCHRRLHSVKGVCRLCDLPQKARRLCDKHYQRLRKHGDPLMVSRGVKEVRAEMKAEVLA